MKIAVMPDTHSPFQDDDAVNLFIKVVKAWKPDILVHIGDLADFYSLTSHLKNPYKDTGFLDELNKVLAVMDKIDGLAPRKIFCEGNHCNRLQRYLFDKAPELYGYLNVETALQLKERGWEYHPYQEVVTVGDCGFVHDLGFAGVNATRQHILAYPGNLVFGHSHRLNSFTMGNLKRQTYTCCNAGWLGDSDQIDYLPSVKVKQDWVSGFVLVEQEKGISHFTPVKITKNKEGKKTAMLNGRIYA